jgi:hypothetical protein
MKRNLRTALAGGDLHPEIAGLLQTMTELSKSSRTGR